MDTQASSARRRARQVLHCAQREAVYPGSAPVIVCLIVPDFPTVGDNSHRHGIGTQSEMVARAWLSVGAEVHVVWYGPRARLLRDDPIVPVQLYRVPIPPENRIPGAAMVVAAAKIARAVRRLDTRHRFDAIEAVHDEGNLLGCALLLGPRLHLRMSTSLEQNLGFRDRLPTLEERACAGLAKMTLRTAATLITHSTAQVEAMRRELGTVRPIAMIPLGIRDPGTGRRQGDEEFRVGYLGKLNVRKGIDVFLRALAFLPPATVAAVVAGKAESAPGGYSSWQAWAEGELDWKGRQVEFLGTVSDADVERFWGSIDVVVVPSRWESFGLVAVEAMARGVPVVTSDGGSLPEVVGEAGVVFPGDDPNALAGILLQLATDPGLRADLRRRGRERFEREYTLLAFADRMQRCFIPAAR